MKLNARKKNILITVGLSGGVVAYTFALLLPTQRSIAALQDEIAAHQSYIAQQQQARDSITKLQAELEQTREFSQHWEANAPDAPRLAPAIGTISQCAAAAGVRTVRLDPRPPEPLALLSRAPVTLEGEGTFLEVFELLRQLESLPHPVWVEHMHLSRPEETSEKIRCELTLVIFADKAENSH